MSLANQKLLKIPILLQEAGFLVVNKPAGMFTQAATGVPSLQSQLASQLQDLQASPTNPFVGLPHRLDKGTSGALLIARNQRSLKRFNEQFQSRKIDKFYLAVVCGNTEGFDGSWQDRVCKLPDEAKAAIAIDKGEGKSARLVAKHIAHDAGLSLLLIQLETGRMHQIRIQAASRGFPLLEDRLYQEHPIAPPTPPAQQLQIQFGPDCLPLHAVRLDFRHPTSARVTHCTADLPTYWSSLPTGILEAAKTLCSALNALPSGTARTLLA